MPFPFISTSSAISSASQYSWLFMPILTSHKNIKLCKIKLFPIENKLRSPWTLLAQCSTVPDSIFERLGESIVSLQFEWGFCFSAHSTGNCAFSPADNFILHRESNHFYFSAKYFSKIAISFVNSILRTLRHRNFLKISREKYKVYSFSKIKTKF